MALMATSAMASCFARFPADAGIELSESPLRRNTSQIASKNSMGKTRMPVCFAVSARPVATPTTTRRQADGAFT